MPLFLRQRVDLADYARRFSLSGERITLTLEGLVAGVDNVRHDVFLSPKFMAAARAHLSRLIIKAGDISHFLVEEQAAKPASRHPAAQADFKALLTELLTASLQRAKAENNISLDVLCRLALIKFLRAEQAAEFNTLLERCRARLKSIESSKHANPTRVIELRERAAAFRVAKRGILRRTGQEILETLRLVERETAGPARRSMFGTAHENIYALLQTRLIFTEDGRDDFVNAEHYVMLGNYERDPDRFAPMTEIACGFLESLGCAPQDVDDYLNVPQNAVELMAEGELYDDDPNAKDQKLVLAAWVDTLEREGVIDHVIASYEVVPLLAEYASVINPQQLKNALISRTERKVVERLIEEHSRLSPDAFDGAVKRTSKCFGAERMRVAGRFFADFIRYHRDIRRLEAVNSGLDLVNLITAERLRELSALNNTLYEFLLNEERKPAEDKVVHHVIIKADIRESTLLTRTLFARGLNPASYFSLNFYDPINKLLPKYGAQKVFIEGDAVILALFERESEAALGVARACALAREIIGVVAAYNEQSRNSNLPTLELGIGIAYQDSAPMYLVDGGQQIMISPALNESDRLSSCSKSARKMLAGVESLFNVFCFQTIADADTAGQPEEFLMRYNIGGINLNQAAFTKLQQEIALEVHQAPLPTIWEEDNVRIYRGEVALGPGMKHQLAIRESRIPHIDARDFQLLEWTERRYYEVCTSEIIHEYLETAKAASAAE